MWKRGGCGTITPCSGKPVLRDRTAGGSQRLRGDNVRVEQLLDGALAVRYGEKYLPLARCAVAAKDGAIAVRTGIANGCSLTGAAGALRLNCRCQGCRHIRKFFADRRLGQPAIFRVRRTGSCRWTRRRAGNSRPLWREPRGTAVSIFRRLRRWRRRFDGA
jgi:hypothetical protein